ncbi:hypothetical protein [Membranihabitans marinus]|uniref:hypothetical protein n=1 Tax=Membranihabitans marinus TaxID=1227546 RepID=UPI001F45B8BF|nr:hypothetical protein [Membranihabitans marinus]
MVQKLVHQSKFLYQIGFIGILLHFVFTVSGQTMHRANDIKPEVVEQLLNKSKTQKIMAITTMGFAVLITPLIDNPNIQGLGSWPEFVCLGLVGTSVGLYIAGSNNQSKAIKMDLGLMSISPFSPRIQQRSTLLPGLGVGPGWRVVYIW